MPLFTSQSSLAKSDWPSPPIELKSPSGRLMLRSPTHRDAAPLHENGSDPRAVKHLPHLQRKNHQGAKPLSETESWLERVVEGHGQTNYLLVIEELETGDVIGDSGVGSIWKDWQGHLEDGAKETADSVTSYIGEIGVMLSPVVWGRGYATEAMEMSIKFAFEQLNLTRVQVGTLEANTAMVAIMIKLGFGEGQAGENSSGVPVRSWKLSHPAEAS